MFVSVSRFEDGSCSFLNMLLVVVIDSYVLSIWAVRFVSVRRAAGRSAWSSSTTSTTNYYKQ